MKAIYWRQENYVNMYETSQHGNDPNMDLVFPSVGATKFSENLFSSMPFDRAG